MTTATALQHIVEDPSLSPAQKARALAVAAENSLPYPPLDAPTCAALEARVICDMYEGNAPYKPRYVLPDYAVVLREGSEWLELPAPQTLDEAINTLMIAWHHVPSVTGLPVYIGQLDELLEPFCEGLSDAALDAKMRLLWRYVDRVLPDAFLHANIGPADGRVARAILRVDAELEQVAPNLTLRYDPASSGEALLAQAISNITRCSKPHIANHPLHAEAFAPRAYGIVSCYNALPLGGGASTLTRLNLRAVAERSGDVTDFMERALPHYVALAARLIRARIDCLFDRSGFFDSFLVEEGWIAAERFAAMFGIFAMAEAVDLLQEKAGLAGRYGSDGKANALGHAISARLAELLAGEPIERAWRGRALLHAQAGLSTDTGLTPGVRIPYGAEPDPVSHVRALAPHHRYYLSGISDILTLEETVKANPEALVQLCKGAFASGFREFTATVAGHDLVRVTGYMVRLSDIAQLEAAQGSRVNTTALAGEAARTTGILCRRPRVVANELAVRAHELAHGPA